VYAGGRAGNPIRSDGFSYYVYLPSWFLFHDTTLSAVARDCCGGVFPAYTAIIRWPGTRRWVNAHPIGVAIMQTPMFGVAHALTRWTNLSPDGFSLYYQHAAGLSGLLWIVAGLVVLRRVLRRHFSDTVTAATLLDSSGNGSLSLRDLRQLLQPSVLVFSVRRIPRPDRNMARAAQAIDIGSAWSGGWVDRDHAAHQRPVPVVLSALRRLEC
jgi:hypothetical protein